MLSPAIESTTTRWKKAPLQLSRDYMQYITLTLSTASTVHTSHVRCWTHQCIPCHGRTLILEGFYQGFLLERVSKSLGYGHTLNSVRSFLIALYRLVIAISDPNIQTFPRGCNTSMTARSVSTVLHCTDSRSCEQAAHIARVDLITARFRFPVN